MSAKKKIKLDPRIYDGGFLDRIQIEAGRFKEARGFGRWLYEYDELDKLGFFTWPEQIHEVYVKMLKDEASDVPYITREATWNIASAAWDKYKSELDERSWEIRVITGELAEDDQGKALRGLSQMDATRICRAMNEEAEELLFGVHKIGGNEI